ncbi:putative hydrolase of the HAD superfamily [Paenibacillus sophorae]|uniref:HAD family hydrolase n=1 Tax=Paenibacillus sophorae TaxID=1333845 RepID=A0A1H8RSK0_9BACL|nr:HAD family hydrolase [Paenibacillus sophorae]QWU17005.1 HAD family hydrolase [Paenibacillus sophorae]SEO69138.1 putative hydrolase of the HAD superfamily [Paenibacillus sophorae]
MIKAVLFDLDGTLLDRDASLKRLIDAQHNRFQNFLGHIPQEVFKTRFVELDSRGYVLKDEVYRQLIDEFEIRGITWEELLDDYSTQFNQNCVPFPNVVEILEHLHNQNILLGMITNGFTAMQLSNIKALGIEQYFSAILVSEQEGIKKPDPQIFMRALEKLGVNPQESIYVGDHPVYDVQASRNVGMIGVWKKDDYWASPVQADFIIDDLFELELVVKKLQA